MGGGGGGVSVEYLRTAGARMRAALAALEGAGTAVLRRERRSAAKDMVEEATVVVVRAKGSLAVRRRWWWFEQKGAWRSRWVKYGLPEGPSGAAHRGSLCLLPRITWID